MANCRGLAGYGGFEKGWENFQGRIRSAPWRLRRCAEIPTAEPARVLLRYAKRLKDPEAIQMVLHTRDLMAMVASTTSWVGVLRVIPSTRSGWSPISRRCFTTTRS
jgi:hypothetical protein